jgi:hypothetical protein
VINQSSSNLPRTKADEDELKKKEDELKKKEDELKKKLK